MITNVNRAYGVGKTLLSLCAGLLLLPAAAQVIQDEVVPAHELVGGPWLNTHNGAPITLASRKGKVTIVHFWTFGCINCKHNFASYARWQKHFEKDGVELISVHTPETRGERSAAAVARRVRQYGITYPVLLDRNGENWSRWHQQYWPTIYLIDKQGRIRYHWEGELHFNGEDGEAEMGRHVEALLKE